MARNRDRFAGYLRPLESLSPWGKSIDLES